jgi:Uma2 family endonuclease
MTASPKPSRRMTPQEYFEFEATSPTKHDYLNGELIDLNELISMAGGSRQHALITANVSGEARQALKGKPCNVYSGDLRMGISRHAHYSYPDLSIVCGKPAYDPEDKNESTATNPTVVIEVLSPSTEKYDRSEKFLNYLRLASLREYVLVSQSSPRVESYRRRDDGQWLFSCVDGLDASLRIEAVDVSIPLSEVYRGVDFPDPQAEPTAAT